MRAGVASTALARQIFMNGGTSIRRTEPAACLK
jgi:hypothetical protein